MLLARVQASRAQRQVSASAPVSCLDHGLGHTPSAAYTLEVPDGGPPAKILPIWSIHRSGQQPSSTVEALTMSYARLTDAAKSLYTMLTAGAEPLPLRSAWHTL